MYKTNIIGDLGESRLLLPVYVDQALQANNRVKYLFTLLQEARRYAEHPDAGATDLRPERLAADVGDAALDDVVPAAQRTSDGNYYIPHVAHLHECIVSAVETMLSPVRIGADEESADLYRQRLDTLLARAPDFSRDEVSPEYIDLATHGRRGHGDSLHLLVMDLHKAINKLQAGLAREDIDGARAYAVGNRDREMISAFMKGLNQTAPLKFDHPGLDTTATRSGGCLVIENDIGTTDAHVLVIHVRGLAVTVTYTDVHERRAEFFEGLLESFDVTWQDTRSRDLDSRYEDDRYYLCVGTFEAGDEAATRDYLAFLGSRLVYLIDWNKARKRLRNFVRKKDVLALLKWAADNDFGHRAFLQVGGERIVYEALAHVSRTDSRYGDRLDKVLGRERSVDYLKFVLETAATGLLNRRSERLIRDEIKAEISNYVQSAQEGIYAICADHAACAFDLADAVRYVLNQANASLDPEEVSRISTLAKRWETRADELLNRVREAARRSVTDPRFRRLAEQADDVVDSLEEAAYLLTLLPTEPLAAKYRQPLQALADLLVEGARSYVRCIEVARHLEESDSREDRKDFLEAVDDVIVVEHRTDAEERRFLTQLIQGDADDGRMHLLSRLTQSFEEAADALARSSMTMKDYVLDEVVTA